MFRICEGTGEWFDLSKMPVERASFSLGGAAEPMLLALSAQALTSDGAFAMVLPPKS